MQFTRRKRERKGSYKNGDSLDKLRDKSMTSPPHFYKIILVSGFSSLLLNVFVLLCLENQIMILRAHVPDFCNAFLLFLKLQVSYRFLSILKGCQEGISIMKHLYR